MTANLIDGKIPEPASLRAARARRAALLAEVERIRGQLADRSRERSMPPRAYGIWRQAAKTASQHLAEEARQLGAWIEAEEGEAARLLRKARDVLRTFLEEEELFPEEEAVLVEIEAYFGEKIAERRTA